MKTMVERTTNNDAQPFMQRTSTTVSIKMAQSQQREMAPHLTPHNANFPFASHFAFQRPSVFRQTIVPDEWDLHPGISDYSVLR
jgi:hypothetical protein